MSKSSKIKISIISIFSAIFVVVLSIFIIGCSSADNLEKHAVSEFNRWAEGRNIDDLVVTNISEISDEIINNSLMRDKIYIIEAYDISSKEVYNYTISVVYVETFWSELVCFFDKSNDWGEFLSTSLVYDF